MTTNKLRTLTSLLLATVLMGWGVAAQADSFTVELSTEFSGADAPEGSTPWMVMTVDDGDSPGTVTITVANSGLVEEEWVSAFYWNFTGDPSFFISGSFTLNGATYDPFADGQTWTTCQNTSDAFCKADGDGYFDYILTFANGVFGAGDVLIMNLSATGITASDFNLVSLPGGGNGSWTAAAHVQSIDQSSENDNGGSGWIGGNPGDTPKVPEPGTLALFGLGLTLLGAATRRRRRVK